MRHHIRFQGNFTWDKVMAHTGYIDNYAAALGKLISAQDANPTMFANVFGTVELPRLLAQPAYERLALGGWQLNWVTRFSNGPLISAPGGIDIIGNYRQPHQTLNREFNTCYQAVTTPNNVATYTPVNTVTKTDATTGNTFNTSTACDAQSPTPAFRQRLGFTSQSNSPVLNIRQPIKPLMDLSVFKKFILREGASFEIRGEFFNVMNTPNWGGPSTSLGAANAGSAGNAGSALYPSGYLTQANDARIGQLTARINF